MIKKKKTSEQLDCRTFYYPLTNIVWSCIIASTVLTVLSKLLSTKYEINLLDIIWTSFATNFGGHFENQNENTNALKVITFVTLFCGNIIWMGYQASLTVDLSAPSNKLPFKDIETFYDLNWNLYTIRKGYVENCSGTNCLGTNCPYTIFWGQKVLVLLF